MGGEHYDARLKVTEYNHHANTWQYLPSLQLERRIAGHSVCTLDTKIFVLGLCATTRCKMFDLSEDDPQWRYIASMNSEPFGGRSAGIEKKIYVLGGHKTDNVEVYDVDQGKVCKSLLGELSII